MADAARDARETWITGIGIVSCLGEGPEAHWQRLNEPPPLPEMQAFAPYLVHPLAPLELDKQIPKKGDQRQMEAWQRIGTYAAGLALDSAGAKGNAELLARMDMIVAAGGGERDETVDAAILSGHAEGGESGGLPQRAADERPAADTVPGAALQPARRQHFDRAWRHRLLAHLHGRGSRRRRRGADRACAHRGRPERHRARRRRPQRRAPGPAAALRVRRACAEGQLRAGLGARRARRRHGARLARRIPGARSARACARARRQAAGAACCRCCRIAATARAMPPTATLLAHVADARAATCARPRRRDLGRDRRRAGDRRRSAPCSPPSPTFRCARPAPISAMASSHNSR